MDPICHTLVGATLSRTGLETKTRYAAATLIIAANLPDIDVVAHAMGTTASYAYRRGITHGIPALIILPILLAAAVWLFGRNRGGGAQGPPVSFKGLLLLSTIGVVSHPILDWMNTYGMRWLMPIVDRWYYGDTLFIIDWIAWLILAVGLTFAIVQRKTPLAWYRRPANLALTALDRLHRRQLRHYAKRRARGVCRAQRETASKTVGIARAVQPTPQRNRSRLQTGLSVRKLPRIHGRPLRTQQPHRSQR